MNDQSSEVATVTDLERASQKPFGTPLCGWLREEIELPDEWDTTFLDEGQTLRFRKRADREDCSCK